jgi:uncharacterized protein (DUF488 family)
MKSLVTIGYEGSTLDSFLNRLEQAKTRFLIDVRELPLSRRKGFSKNSLREALSRRGIEYMHVRALGAPKPIRNELRATGDYNVYFRQFNEYLRSQRDALDAIAKQCGGVVALMCYERNPAECHRSAVARELGKMANVSPLHLEVEEPHAGIRETTRLHTRQGLPAA